MANNKNPWMALEAYQESDDYKFKGRDNDSENLLTMLKQNECVVCYAASGDGKSSLINAGVCPKMRKSGLFPIKIIFTTAEYEGSNMPLMQNGEKIDFNKLIYGKIKESISDYEKKFAETHNIDFSGYKIVFEKNTKYSTKNIPSDISDNLWWKLRTETIQVPFGEYDFIPVLIFDQFEEIFRSTWKEEFFQWIEMLMKDVCPTNISELLEDSDIEIPTKKLFKTIFSMRYEYVGELDYWCSQRTFIPQMMHNRYFLKPLTSKDAIEIIESQDTTDPISKKISDNSNLLVKNICNKESNEVSPIILSMLCYGIYEKLHENENYSISEEAIHETISSFYDKTLKGIKIKGSNSHIPKKHLKIIENALVDEKGHRLRLPVNITDLKTIDFSEKYCNALKEAHLIRLYEINDESYVELIHDRIAEIIVDKRVKKALRNKTYFKWALLGVLALAIAVYGIYLMNRPSEAEIADNTKYSLLLKASQDSTISDYHWKVRLMLNTQDETPLQLGDSLVNDTILERGKREEICLSLSQKEIKTLQKIILHVQPVNALYKAKDDTIMLKLKNDTFFVAIEKNIEETMTFNGSVSSKRQGLHHAMVIMGEYVTYTDASGDFSLIMPRGTQLQSIYTIKEGYTPKKTRISSDENEHILIFLERDTTYQFKDRWVSFAKLWDMAGYTARNNTKISNNALKILDEFHINNKKEIKRQFEINDKNDTLYKYVFYDPERQKVAYEQSTNSVKQDNKNVNEEIRKGTVRKFIGSDMKNHRILEGKMTLVDPVSSLWEVEAIALDSIFNTHDVKGTVIKGETSTFNWY